MRTTLTLDDDVDGLLRRAVAEGRGSFRTVVNAALRAGLGTTTPTRRYSVTPVDMGVPVVDVTHALRLAADLEDDEIVRKLERRR